MSKLQIDYILTPRYILGRSSIKVKSFFVRFVYEVTLGVIEYAVVGRPPDYHVDTRR